MKNSIDIIKTQDCHTFYSYNMEMIKNYMRIMLSLNHEERRMRRCFNLCLVLIVYTLSLLAMISMALVFTHADYLSMITICILQMTIVFIIGYIICISRRKNCKMSTKAVF